MGNSLLSCCREKRLENGIIIIEEKLEYVGDSLDLFFRAKLEAEPGMYYWSSSLERLKKRSAYYLNKLPSYFSVRNWWEYLTELISEDLEFFKTYWSSLRTNTVNGKPLGKKSFVERVLSFIRPPSLSI